MKTEYIDPICGMAVTPTTAAGNYTHKGETYYFCSKGCLEKFKKQVGGEPASSGSVQLGRKKISDEPMRIDTEGTEVDTVCKMLVSPETAAAKYEYDGKIYYFCAVGCKERFAAEPEKFLVGNGYDHSHPTVKLGDMTAAPAGEFTDPVCRMKVSPDSAVGNYYYKGETY